MLFVVVDVTFVFCFLVRSCVYSWCTAVATRCALHSQFYGLCGRLLDSSVHDK